MPNQLLYVGVLMVTPLITMLIIALMIPPHLLHARREPDHKQILAGIALMAMAFIGTFLISLSFIHH